MLTFDQKIAIAASFPELTRKDVSLGRVNYHYEDSLHEKKTVIYHLHPNGNGFVYAALVEGEVTDDKGLVNIRDYGEEEFRSIIAASIASLSEGAPEPKPVTKRDKAPEQHWIDPEGRKLRLLREDDLWYVYAGLNLEMAFETIEEALEYLREEGCTRQEG